VLNQRYSDYHALLLPSLRWEGLPNTVIEGMAKGLTVIASNIGGPRDIIENGQNGLLVPPNEPLKLAAVIKELIDTPSLAADLGSSAIQTVRQKYTSEQMLDQYEAFVGSFLASLKENYVNIVTENGSSSERHFS
jgi:glycosyltransferase involved in cell wall biosynthesis